MGHNTISFRKRDEEFIMGKLPSNDCYLKPEFEDGRLHLYFKKPITCIMTSDWTSVLEGEPDAPKEAVVKEPKNDFVHFLKNKGKLRAFLSRDTAERLCGRDVSRESIKLLIEIHTDGLSITNS